MYNGGDPIHDPGTLNVYVKLDTSTTSKLLWSLSGNQVTNLPFLCPFYNLVISHFLT